jgi:hypothetical protein
MSWYSNKPGADVVHVLGGSYDCFSACGRYMFTTYRVRKRIKRGKRVCLHCSAAKRRGADDKCRGLPMGKVCPP